MTEKEFTESINNKLDSLHKKMDCVTTEIETVKRGIYGDEKNKVKGLLERQATDESRLHKLEQKQYKTFVWGGVILTGLQMLWNIIKERL